jgi:hypothetical protein
MDLQQQHMRGAPKSSAKEQRHWYGSEETLAAIAACARLQDCGGSGSIEACKLFQGSTAAPQEEQHQRAGAFALVRKGLGITGSICATAGLWRLHQQHSGLQAFPSLNITRGAHTTWLVLKVDALFLATPRMPCWCHYQQKYTHQLCVRCASTSGEVHTPAQPLLEPTRGPAVLCAQHQQTCTHQLCVAQLNFNRGARTPRLSGRHDWSS